MVDKIIKEKLSIKQSKKNIKRQFLEHDQHLNRVRKIKINLMNK